MKTFLSTAKHQCALALAGAALVLAPAVASAQDGGTETPPQLEKIHLPAEHEVIDDLGLHGNAFMAGNELATALSQSTGMAISPLIGVSALGAYTYFKEPEASRGALPWWAHPKAWGIGLSLVALAFLRDTFGAVLPYPIRKPLQLLDSIEDKVSALVAGIAVTPSLYYVGEAVLTAQGVLTPMGTTPTGPVMMVAGFDSDSVIRASLAAGSVGAFGIVWFVSHATNILVVLSPFKEVDVILKTLKVAFLAFYVLIVSFIPGGKFVLPILLILACIPIFGWALRLNVFGTLLGWDFTRKIIRKPAKEIADKNGAVRAFATKALDDIPTRSYGKVRMAEDGTLEFVYRSLPFMPKKTLTIDPDSYELAIQNGLLVPGVSGCPRIDEDTSYMRLLDFRLAARGREEEISELFGGYEVRPWALARGLKAAWSWIRNQGARSKNALTSAVDKIEDTFDGDGDDADQVA